MQLLKGADVVAAMKEKMLARCEALKKAGVEPCLSIVRLGARPDDLAYERGACKRMESVGITVRVTELPEDITTAALEAELRAIGNNPLVHGVLLFRPLPAHIDMNVVKHSVPAHKDVDCMNPESLAKLFEGDSSGFAPCTPEGVMELLDHYGIALSGTRVTVVGRSLVVGKPLAMLLLSRHATVTVCHTRTVDLEARCREADLLIAAAGSARMITRSHVREGQVVVDVGINVTPEGELCGDVDTDAVSSVVRAVTPVPGGVGTVTSSVLAAHVLRSAETALKTES